MNSVQTVTVCKGPTHSGWQLSLKRVIGTKVSHPCNNKRESGRYVCPQRNCLPKNPLAQDVAERAAGAFLLAVHITVGVEIWELMLRVLTLRDFLKVFVVVWPPPSTRLPSWDILCSRSTISDSLPDFPGIPSCFLATVLPTKTLAMLLLISGLCLPL